MTTLRIPFHLRPLAVASLVLAVACGDQPDAQTTPPPAAPPPVPAATAPPPSGGGEVGLQTSRGQVTGNPAAAAPPQGSADPRAIVAPGARFILPAAWQRERPASSMRLAQARIDGPDGPGLLTVFYFGAGGGGPVDQNLSRWIGQVELTPGTEPRRESFTQNGFAITTVEAEGVLKPSSMGVGPDTPQPDSRLLAAVVEGPGGPWFFKLTGPAATLAAARDDFLTMLRSVTATP